jgi:glycosyltransferase involved in cell wall biosynthesis
MLRDPAKRLAARSVRRALVRAAGGARHRGSRSEPARKPKLYIVLMHAWGMGGTIRTSLNLAAQLAESHDVELLSMVRRRDRPFFDFPPGVTVTAIDDQRPRATPRHLRLPHALLSRRPSMLMPAADRSARACSLWTDAMFASALRKRAPGVLIGTRPGLNMLVAELAPLGWAKVGQEHMNLSAHRPPLRRAIRARYPALDALVVLTEADARAYAAEFGDALRVVRIPNAAPTPDAALAPLSTPTVLAAGRLTPQKGFDRLIPAFAHVVDRHPEWQLRICGRGRQRPMLKALIASHALERNVTLAGAVSRLDTEMERASMFVLSSRFEGFPMVLLEAMSKGLPVVSFDCPTGPREVVEDGVNGLLVPPGDVLGLAAAMLQMVDQEQLRRDFGEHALVTASRFAPAQIGRRWQELLGELTAR